MSIIKKEGDVQKYGNFRDEKLMSCTKKNLGEISKEMIMIVSFINWSKSRF